MLLLMRRVGEAVRIKEDIVIEITKIRGDEVVFKIQHPQESKLADKKPAPEKI